MNDDASLSLVTSPPLVIGACCIALLKQEMTKFLWQMHDTVGKKNMGYYYAWKAFLATQWSLLGAAFTRRKEMM
jgi:hypothetical protein